MCRQKYDVKTKYQHSSPLRDTRQAEFHTRAGGDIHPSNLLQQYFNHIIFGTDHEHVPMVVGDRGLRTRL